MRPGGRLDLDEETGLPLEVERCTNVSPTPYPKCIKIPEAFSKTPLDTTSDVLKHPKLKHGLKVWPGGSLDPAEVRLATVLT